MYGTKDKPLTYCCYYLPQEITFSSYLKCVFFLSSGSLHTGMLEHIFDEEGTEVFESYSLHLHIIHLYILYIVSNLT